MSQIKAIFLYVLALIVLLAPVIILGWVGLSLLSWPGLIIGIIAGGLIFMASMNKVIQQGDEEDEEDEAAEAVIAPEVATADKQ